MRHTNLPGLFVLTFALPAYAQPAIIPETGHSYFLTPQRVSWHEARAYAESVGGYLASVGSADEQDWIAETFAGAGDQLWIGYSDELLEGAWGWEDGRPSVFTAWAPRRTERLSVEPNRGGLRGH